MTNIYEMKKILFVIVAFLAFSFSFPAQAQKETNDQIGYRNIEYYTLESVRNSGDLSRKFIRAIKSGARSAGISPEKISIPRTIFLTSDVPFADDHANIVPLIQIGQREGQQHIFLNITPARLLTEAWLLKHPQGSPEVLNISVINSVELGQLRIDWEKNVIHGYFYEGFEIWRFRNRIPKALAFLPEIFSVSGRGGFVPFSITSAIALDKCFEDTLPFLEKIVEKNLQLFAQEPKENILIVPSEAPDLLSLVPECL